ncbi:MAG: 30S ribosome-binding factor RbfA [Coriobacteriales bacterium]|jgi:ribosome-binding factor A|nr:30S ribosome-binding factor RbfA [Coriobacteriales bacterium]
MTESQQSRKNNETVKEALAAILMFEMADPRLQTLTISGVVVSTDRSVARVYVLADRVDDRQAIDGLEAASGRIRSLLGKRLGWRATPKLRFFLDPMMDHAARIESVLRDAPTTIDTEKDADGYPLDGAEELFVGEAGSQEDDINA